MDRPCNSREPRDDPPCDTGGYDQCVDLIVIGFKFGAHRMAAGTTQQARSLS